MTALLTAADVQARGIGVDLDPDVLDAIISDEEAALIARFGPHGDGATSVTETIRTHGGRIYLARPFDAISSVSIAAYPGGTVTVLAANRYYVWPDALDLNYDSCGEVLTVTYIPTDDRALRRAVLLDLVKLAIDESLAPAAKVSGMGFSIEAGASMDWSGARVSAVRRLIPFGV